MRNAAVKAAMISYQPFATKKLFTGKYLTVLLLKR